MGAVTNTGKCMRVLWPPKHTTDWGRKMVEVYSLSVLEASSPGSVLGVERRPSKIQTLESSHQPFRTWP